MSTSDGGSLGEPSVVLAGEKNQSFNVSIHPSIHPSINLTASRARGVVGGVREERISKVKKRTVGRLVGHR